ncbi:hypothetical protein G195_000586 [Phytophthora kernoviae 00238/432]|uniref:protein-N(pi)-phosphohistidine--D-mannitol phosphotransferase n=1 Tax=Phytophthora kernoviae 00238/432 TaxID=1284355 RepID=A0A8J4WBV6_9STRA|nr:hypothetical protein G195_000586 [Phytophthora kernoviae 00238/432]
MVHGQRGGVVGAIMTIGVIVGSDIPMFLGAMIAGPLGAWVIKKFDKAVDGKIKSGFEMLVNNFSAGIIGGILALLALKGIGPFVEAISKVLSAGVETLMNAGLLPLVNLIIEPGKVLFLNNAINHGILTPIGVAVAAIISFLVASVLLKTGKQKDDEDLDTASSRMKDMKNQGKTGNLTVDKDNREADRMGSSAMGASILRKKMKAAGVDVAVTNTAISEIPQDADIVITQKTLTDRAKSVAPNAEHISIDNFLKSPEYEALVERLKSDS